MCRYQFVMLILFHTCYVSVCVCTEISVLDSSSVVNLKVLYTVLHSGPLLGSHTSSSKCALLCYNLESKPVPLGQQTVTHQPTFSCHINLF